MFSNAPKMADFEPDNVCTTTQKFRNLKTTLAWMKTLCISRAPKESIKKTGLLFYGASAQGYRKSSKIRFSHLGKKWSLFLFPKGDNVKQIKYLKSM